MAKKKSGGLFGGAKKKGGLFSIGKKTSPIEKLAKDIGKTVADAAGPILKEGVKVAAEKAAGEAVKVITTGMP